MHKRIRTTAMVALAIVAPLLLGANACSRPQGTIVTIGSDPSHCPKEDAPVAIVVHKDGEFVGTDCVDHVTAGKYAVGDTYP